MFIKIIGIIILMGLIFEFGEAAAGYISEKISEYLPKYREKIIMLIGLPILVFIVIFIPLEIFESRNGFYENVKFAGFFVGYTFLFFLLIILVPHTFGLIRKRLKK